MKWDYVRGKKKQKENKNKQTKRKQKKNKQKKIKKKIIRQFGSVFNKKMVKSVIYYKNTLKGVNKGQVTGSFIVTWFPHKIV